MQAIILAAGMGKRLKELTAHNTKCMVEVNGVTLIERLLRQLDGLQLSKVVLVVGYCADALKKHVKQLPLHTPVVYVDNPVYYKTNNIYSLYLAKEYLCAEDTLLFESDLIVEDTVIEKIVTDPFPNLALVAKFQSWMDGTVVTLDSQRNITRFISTKEFQFNEIPHYYKTVNIYKFSREFSLHRYIPFMEAYCQTMGHNAYYEQVLRVITYLDNGHIKALPLDHEYWYEIDDFQDLDIAQSIFADAEVRATQLTTRYGGYWRYSGLLDACYLVNPYFPNARLNAEIKANFESLLSQYPSGLRINNLLAAKDFNVKQSYLTVGNGAAQLIKCLLSQLQGTLGYLRPTFEEYPNRLPPERLVPLTPFRPHFAYSGADVMQLVDTAPQRIDHLLLINPDNPSANFLPQSEVIALCEFTASRGMGFILDESFVDFAQTPYTFLDNELLAAYPHLTVIKSISKSYGVPGLRLGVMATANSNLLNAVEKELSIWHINSFAEFFLQIVEKYMDDYHAACRELSHERDWFGAQLATLSYLQVCPSQANYFFCEITKDYTPIELISKLLNQFNILIKDASRKVDGRPYIRIAVRSREDNERVLRALRALEPVR